MNPPPADPMRLHELTRRAITASAALTCASAAGPAISDAQYARMDDDAHNARHDLRDCLHQDYGIDAAMADKLASLL